MPSSSTTAKSKTKPLLREEEKTDFPVVPIFSSNWKLLLRAKIRVQQQLP
jgi:hypothetical protein